LIKKLQKIKASLKLLVFIQESAFTQSGQVGSALYWFKINFCSSLCGLLARTTARHIPVKNYRNFHKAFPFPAGAGNLVLRLQLQ
jgi:hypothetical protein